MNYIFVAFERIGDELGTGHVVRINRMLNLLTKNSSSKSESNITYISNHAVESSRFQSIVVSGLDDGREKILECIEKHRVDVIVFDCLDFLHELHILCRKKNIFTIGIDVSDGYSDDLDLSINPVITNSKSFLNLSAYAIHHEVISPTNLIKYNEKSQNLFICFGGLDYQKHLFHISDYLKQIPIAWKINIVVSNQDDLNINIGSLKNVHLYFKPDNFYEMLQESSAAIISGGILLQEAIYLGIPSFIIPQYEHQFEISQGHLREKVCIGVSQINPDYKSAINSIVNSLDSKEQLQDISIKARSVSDGFGAKRIASILKVLEYLDWDSNFFKKEIFCITCKTYTDSVKVKIEDALLNHRIDLIYFLCPQSNHEAISQALNDNFIQVDERVTYLIGSHQFNGYITPTHFTISHSSAEHSMELQALAETVEWKTRYTNDKNFHQSDIRKFYREWVSKSIEGKLDDAVYHIKDGERIKGFISIKKEGVNFGSIGLVAVSSCSQGKGFGAALVSFAVNFLIESNGCAAVQVVTQSDNIGAQKTYEKIGFSVTDKSVWLHKWM